jgi:hypothetical protein
MLCSRRLRRVHSTCPYPTYPTYPTYQTDQTDATDQTYQTDQTIFSVDTPKGHSNTVLVQ